MEGPGKASNALFHWQERGDRSWSPLMDWQLWFTLGLVGLALFAMVREFAQPDLVLMATLFGLAAVGVLTPAEAFSGFANPAVGAIGALFIVSAALRETGALDVTLARLLTRARTAVSGTLRICVPVAMLSAFLNNAPIVAMMTPAVIDWARRNRLSPSRFLIPLSYAAILGSCTTIIGTSVNLTVAGLITSAGMPEMRFFELLPVGLPIALIGLGYLTFAAPHLLPRRDSPDEDFDERRREYVTTMLVTPECPLVGEQVEAAGLRQLPGLFLVEIDRQGHVITPVGPEEVMCADDRLVFAGVVSTIVDLQKIRGLVPADESDPMPTDHKQRMVEAVVSPSSPLVNRSIRDSNFRSVYDAAVIAVHRNGERLAGKIGEIVLRPGDTLLMQSSSTFLRAHGNSPDFYLVSELQGNAPRRHHLAWVALAALVLMVASVATGVLHISVAAFLAAGAMILTRCLDGPKARESVQWSILIVIGAGLGIALAMQKTGAAALVAGGIVSTVGSLGPLAALAAVYAVTLFMAETLHHNAAAAIMFPIAVATANQLGVDPRGFIMAIALGAACAFASPVTYQTHLIVYGPGGYRFTDFARVGLPLDILCGAVALTLIPIVWPLS